LRGVGNNFQDNSGSSLVYNSTFYGLLVPRHWLTFCIPVTLNPDPNWITTNLTYGVEMLELYLKNRTGTALPNPRSLPYYLQKLFKALSPLGLPAPTSPSSRSHTSHRGGKNSSPQLVSKKTSTTSVPKSTQRFSRGTKPKRRFSSPPSQPTKQS
jgi:hypothetical protein